MVKTKIICTLGPASSNQSILRKMIFAGMDVARLNFSHGIHKEHLKKIALIREINKRYHRHIRILGDLEGYRIRIGTLKDSKPIELKKKQTIWLTKEDIKGEGNIAPFDYRGSLDVIKRGANIYIDDGSITLAVKGRSNKCLRTEVVRPGLLKERKGINIPGARLVFEALTEKDKGDIKFCIENKFDFIAQSFVRTEKDILKIKRLINDKLPQCRVIAKIESREGIKNIERIINVSDGIMIARGDMGICIPIYEIPVIQKEIIRKCNMAGKFVITATQMLESMTEHIIPTRAEVTDCANAIIDGSDFLMLSAETATGKYPVESVDMMNKIIRFTEGQMKPKLMERSEHKFDG